MKRILVLMLVLGLVPAGTAAAKGPTRATITGPGLPHAIVLGGNAEGNASSRFGQLVEQSGWFSEVFRQTPDPTSRTPPRGRLGARYDAVYVVPTGSAEAATIRQELYPFAAGGPVTHLRAGQPIFGMTTNGGWYSSPATLRRTLVALGLPAREPSLKRSGLGAGAWTGIGVGIALVLGTAAALGRRRSGEAHA